MLKQFHIIAALSACCLLPALVSPVQAESAERVNNTRSSICPAPKLASNSEPLPEPSAEQLHAAMEAAVASGLNNMDWVDDPNANNPCRGYYQTPANPSHQQHLEPSDADMYASADNATKGIDGVSELSGNVELYHGGLRLRCDQLRYSTDQGFSEFSGNIQLRSNDVLVIADEASIDYQSYQGLFSNTRYVLQEPGLHGSAGNITFSGNDNTESNQTSAVLQMEDASFTLCPPGREHWAFSTSELNIDYAEGWGSAKHTLFRIEDVPVLYLPYIDFPIDDRRKTGFLWPSFSGDSQTGFDLAVPYYFNLAPNYDMTYIARANHKRGYQHGMELRYKQRYAEWSTGGTYNNHDRLVSEDDDSLIDDDRWLGFLKEDGRFNSNWSTRIDYINVSDPDYFRDWGTRGLDIRKSLNLKRQAQLNFHNENWLISSTLLDYQSLQRDDMGDIVQEEYRHLPRIDLDYRNRYSNFALNPLLSAQYTYFNHDELPKAHRLYTAPGVSFPMHWQAGEVVPVAKVKRTGFNVEDNNSTFDGHDDTVVASFGLDSSLFFERELSLAGIPLTQTLKPRLFYYYADYQDQAHLPVFDTNENEFSYQQLFREERFSSYDRISDAKQLTWEISTELLEHQNGYQLFSIGIGQILYQRERLVTLNTTDRDLEIIDASDSSAVKKQKEAINIVKDRKYYRDASDMALASSLRLDDEQRLTASLIWDPYHDSTTESGMSYHYLNDNGTIFNAGIRYKEVIPLIDANGELFDSNTYQTDISVYLPLGVNWNVFSRWQYDLSKNETVEDLTGIEYRGCCWAVSMAYQRERETFNDGVLISETDNVDYRYGWYIEFELVGLGAVSNTIGRLLEERIQGYRQRD